MSQSAAASTQPKKKFSRYFRPTHFVLEKGCHYLPLDEPKKDRQVRLARQATVSWCRKENIEYVETNEHVLRYYNEQLKIITKNWDGKFQNKEHKEIHKHLEQIEESHKELFKMLGTNNYIAVCKEIYLQTSYYEYIMEK